VGRTPKNQLKIYHRATSNQDVFSDAAATKNTKEVKRFAGKDIIAVKSSTARKINSFRSTHAPVASEL
jgi:hypothetical protein